MERKDGFTPKVFDFLGYQRGWTLRSHDPSTMRSHNSNYQSKSSFFVWKLQYRLTAKENTSHVVRDTQHLICSVWPYIKIQLIFPRRAAFCKCYGVQYEAVPCWYMGTICDSNLRQAKKVAKCQWSLECLKQEQWSRCWYGCCIVADMVCFAPSDALARIAYLLFSIGLIF